MSDLQYMSLALELAKSAVGQTSPNPAVGAVIVNKGEIVGMGAHLKAGTPHAEIHALNMAGNLAKGATAYVTLEPCSHYGKTPPCADALIDNGIGRVVIATYDPNPKVAGNGVEKLRSAGIDVTVGVKEKEAQALNEPFFHFVTKKKPFVTLKIAQSIDGKTATKTGKSQWITSEAARADGHDLRRTHDGIIVGVQTVIADNPTLTNRSIRGGKHPVRIILDRGLRTPETAGMVHDQKAPTLIVAQTGHQNDAKVERLKRLGVSFIFLENPTIEETLNALGARGLMSVLIEGGATLHDAFLQSEAFDRVVVYMAPKLIGGRQALTSVAGVGFEDLSDVPELIVQSIEMIDKDVKIVYGKKGDA